MLSAAAAISSGDNEVISMQRKRVLWVDDDLMFYSSYKEELEEDYLIDVVTSPKKMWAALEAHETPYYCGIVLDVLLPFEGVDAEQSNGGLRTGLALLEWLKGNEKFRRIPVVIFTIRENEDVDKVGRKYNVPVLRKSSVRIAEFIAVIKETFI